MPKHAYDPQRFSWTHTTTESAPNPLTAAYVVFDGPHPIAFTSSAGVADALRTVLDLASQNGSVKDGELEAWLAHLRLVLQ